MKRKPDAGHFRVDEEKPVRLQKWPTRIRPLYRGKKGYRDSLADFRKDIANGVSDISRFVSHRCILRDNAGQQAKVELINHRKSALAVRR